MKKSWDMYAHENTRDNGEKWFAHVGEKKWVELHMLKEPIVAVKVTLDEKGTYWGWMHSSKDKPSMIYPSLKLLEMCFPYGLEIEVEHGNGKAVRLTIVRREEK